MSVTFSRPGGEPQSGPAVPARHPAEILREFRGELYRCLTRRGDALFELGDAVLCRQDRVHMLAELSLEPEHQRGHGALYDALNCGSVQIARLRWALAGGAVAGLG